jgi:hypothetical protein
MGLFVAVGWSGSQGRIATSSDGITWTNRTILGNQQWADCVYAPELGLIAMVSNDTVASTDKAATSSLPARVPTSYNIFDSQFNRIDESGIWTFSQTRISTSIISTATIGNINDSTNATGSANQTLSAGSGGASLTWVNPSLISAAPVTIAATPGTVAATESFVIVNVAGTTTLTLPTATAGKMLIIKTIEPQLVNSASSNVIPVTGGAAGTAILTATDGQSAILVGNGTNWEIMLRSPL